jgi:hypothetical protein
MSGSSKGAANERDECRYLSLWWTQDLDEREDDVFWRNRVKVTSKTPSAEKQLGDMTCLKTIGLAFLETFNVEHKIGYSKKKKDKKVRWDLLETIDSKILDDNLVLLKFWKQCEDDAILSNRIPLLIFQRDRYQPVVCIDAIHFSPFFEILGMPQMRRLMFVDYKSSLRLTLFRRDDFFEWLTPESVRLVHKQWIHRGKIR